MRQLLPQFGVSVPEDGLRQVLGATRPSGIPLIPTGRVGTGSKQELSRSPTA